MSFAPSAVAKCLKRMDLSRREWFRVALTRSQLTVGFSGRRTQKAGGARMSGTQEAAFHVRFEGMTAADANLAAIELRSMLERSGDGIQAQVVKERDDTQDFGATLLLILGTKAAITVAKAIHSYIAKRGDRVVIETADGKVVASGSGAANIDVSKTIAAMQSQLDES